MRICLLSPSLLRTPPYFGGAIETFTYELGLGLAQLDNDVIIITRDGASLEPKLESNLTIKFLQIPNNNFIRGLIYNFKIITSLLKLKSIDILHTQGTSVFPGAFYISRRLRSPIIHTEHVYYPWISAHRSSSLKRIKYPIEQFLGKFSLKHADRIVVANEFMRDSIQNINLKLKSKLEIIPQGINQNLFNPKISKTYIRKKYNLLDTDKIILYVGRIIPEKNIDILIKAFYKLKRKYDNIKLLLVGPKHYTFPTSKNDEKFSTYSLKLINWIYKKGLLDSVIISGSVPYRIIPYYYGGSTLLVQPSLLETFGRSIFEAASIGIPFICNQVGKDIPEYLPKLSGIFIKGINVTKLQEAIKTILENEEDFKKEGEKAAIIIHNKYNWIKIAQKYLRIYKEVVK